MNILIFAGTKNGRELIKTLLDRGQFIFACSATDYGASLLGTHKNLTNIIGKKNQTQITELVLKLKVDLIIDSTHPYAIEVSKNIYNTSVVTGLDTIRFDRPSTIPKGLGIHFESMFLLNQFLKKKKGNILYTTGVNEIPNTVKQIELYRIFTRVLPIKRSLSIIKSSSLPLDQVITENPPFSLKDNLQHIKSFNIEYLVTKDSGAEGNIDQKIAAVKESDIKLLVIDRPENLYNKIYYYLDEILDYVDNKVKRNNK